jgi:ribosomal protein L23
MAVEAKRFPKAFAEGKKAELKDYEVIVHPLVSEKAVGMIEKENKVCFIVNGKANKKQVAGWVEKRFNVRVDSVNMLRDMKGRKKAIVKINKEFKADSIATKLGVI